MGWQVQHIFLPLKIEKAETVMAILLVRPMLGIVSAS